MTLPSPPPRPSLAWTPVLRLACAGVLGGVAALLVACGSSSGKLIPLANAGPLTGDVEAIERAAEEGNGNCSATEAAIAKAEQDFTALPSSIDAGLRNTLRQGIANLRTRALVLCAQPLASSTVTSTAPKTSSARTTPTTPTTPSSSGGGTPAPGEGSQSEGTPEERAGPGGGTGAGEGRGQGEEHSNGRGLGAGGAPQEGGK